MKELLERIRACRICAASLLHGPHPVVQADRESRLLIIGQAPGARVHESGVPWADASGKRLREWLDLDESVFYDERRVALVPMSFCFPGKGKSGDLPPRSECAPLWHGELLGRMRNLRLTLLVGMYSQRYYLESSCGANLTETVRNYHRFLPDVLPLPHPSPRNQFWLAKNRWFESELLPVMRERIREAFH